jgi:hypothetical protein
MPHGIRPHACVVSGNGIALESQRRCAAFAVALASSGDVSERYWSWGIPVTYFIDRDGNLRERFLGSRDWASARAQQLLAEFADSAAAH